VILVTIEYYYYLIVPFLVSEREHKFQCLKIEVHKKLFKNSDQIKFILFKQSQNLKIKTWLDEAMQEIQLALRWLYRMKCPIVFVWKASE